MDTKAIRQWTEVLDKKRQQLDELKQEASLLTLSGNQDQIRVTVGTKGRSIAVSEMGRDWAQHLIRGREMILLGVKKAYAAMIAEAEAEILEVERKIAEATKAEAA